MQLSKWGNSLAIRIPASVVEALDLKEGDDIDVLVRDAQTFELKRKPTPKDLLARIRKFRGKLPDDFKFDRDEANAR
jgi:antitoxin MazE